MDSNASIVSRALVLVLVVLRPSIDLEVFEVMTEGFLSFGFIV